MIKDAATIKTVRVSAYRIPTDYPESDGTFAWDQTTMVLAELQGGGQMGTGYTYGHSCIADLIKESLTPLLIGASCIDIPALHKTMTEKVRNNGKCGLTMMAISAIDHALWDLKARILGVPLVVLLGAAQQRVQVYGSGGFTSYPVEKLQKQMADWATAGFQQVKMKVGREPEKDVKRVKAVREALGDEIEIFVDANGSYAVKEALEMAYRFADLGVSWLEEPVPSNNVQGLKFIREQAPVPIRIAAGEYAYHLSELTQLITSGAVDILQADATRCSGLSTFMKAGDFCEIYQIPFSSHCAPALHLHPAMALPSFYTAEYFYDHMRIENMFFDGIVRPVKGMLYPNTDSIGTGLTLKRADAEKFEL